MKVLVDTCVLSEIRRPNPDHNVVARLSAVPDAALFLSVITIGELVNGINQLAIGKKRRDLEQWLSQIEHHHAARILPIDSETARIWGKITAHAAGQGRVVPAADGLLAATAIRHGLQVLTRNTPDFQATGALLSDPWQE